ncbi:unnamed protein product [Rhodiola kirilowii]
MARTLKNSLKLFLKLVNAVFGAIGLFFLVFGLWLLRVWQREVADGSTSSYPVPWVVYASIGFGVGLCLMSFLGHIAADTANTFCLSFYLVIIFVLMVLEIAFAADVFMNSDWEKDLPEDSTGMLDDITDYVASNSEKFRWVGLSIVFAQVLSVLLTIMLRNAGAQYDIDEDYEAPRRPLLHHQCSCNSVPAPKLFVGAEPSFAATNEAW